MNFKMGLERVSAVWWGLLGLLGLALLVGCLTKGDLTGAVAGALGAGAAYAAHRLTCWIIAGFFSPQS